MRIGYLVFRPDSLTYTICRALRECGHEVTIWVTDPEFGKQPEGGIQKRLSATTGLRFVAADAAGLPPAIDRLIIQTFPRPKHSVRAFPGLAARARRITLVSAGDRSRSWRSALRLQLLEARSLGQHALRVDRVLYKDGFYRADLFGALRRRQVVGFDTHSQFLDDTALFDLIHAQDWNPQARRPLLANFLGSRDPAARLAVLDAVRHLFVGPSGEPRVLQPNKSMLWHEYPDSNPIGLPTHTFIDVLTRSDFTLCPRGYSLVTHRPVEALLRGSIPLLAADELGLYGFALKDGVNCIAVGRKGWAAAIARAAAMNEATVAAMRENIAAMRPTALEYHHLAANICRRAGIEPASVSSQRQPLQPIESN